MTDEHEQLERELAACKPSPMPPDLRRAIVEDTDRYEVFKYRIHAPFAMVAGVALAFGVLGLVAGIKIGHDRAMLVSDSERQPFVADQHVPSIHMRRTQPGAQSARVLLSAFNNDTLDDALNSGQDQGGPAADPTPAFNPRRGVEG